MKMPPGASAGGRFTTAIVALTMGAVLVYAGIAARVSAIMEYDPAIGFLVWGSMESGGQFNQVRSVSRSDLAVDESLFMAAYSPGQYLLPGALTKFGLSLRTAVWLTTLLAVSLGMLGYFLLFRRVLGFAGGVAALSCLILFLTRPVGLLFFEYTGGTLLEFAGIPYMILGAVFCIERHIAWRLALPLIFLAGAFLKLSMAVLSLSLCIYAVWADLRDPQRSLAGRIARASAAMLSFALFYAAMTVSYTSRGWTAASANHGGIAVSTALFSGIYSVASLSAGVTSVFAMLPPLKSALDPAALTKSAGAAAAYVPLLAALAPVSILIIAWVVRRRFSRTYPALLLAVSFTYVAAMISIYVHGGARLEYRHFWVVGALLLPGIVEGLSMLKGAARVAACAAGVLVCVFGIASCGIRALQDARAVRVGDLSYAPEDREIVTLIAHMEEGDSHPGAVIFANDPRVALLVKKHRLAFTSGGDFDSDRYRGEVNSLIVIVETRAVLDKTPRRIIAMFPEMSNWRSAAVGAFTVLVAGPGEPPAALSASLRPL